MWYISIKMVLFFVFLLVIVNLPPELFPDLFEGHSYRPTMSIHDFITDGCDWDRFWNNGVNIHEQFFEKL